MSVILLSSLFSLAGQISAEGAIDRGTDSIQNANIPDSGVARMPSSSLQEAWDHQKVRRSEDSHLAVLLCFGRLVSLSWLQDPHVHVATACVEYRACSACGCGKDPSPRRGSRTFARSTSALHTAGAAQRCVEVEEALGEDEELSKFLHGCLKVHTIPHGTAAASAADAMQGQPTRSFVSEFHSTSRVQDQALDTPVCTSVCLLSAEDQVMFQQQIPLQQPHPQQQFLQQQLPSMQFQHLWQQVMLVPVRRDE